MKVLDSINADWAFWGRCAWLETNTYDEFSIKYVDPFTIDWSKKNDNAYREI